MNPLVIIRAYSDISCAKMLPAFSDGVSRFHRCHNSADVKFPFTNYDEFTENINKHNNLEGRVKIEH